MIKFLSISATLFLTLFATVAYALPDSQSTRSLLPFTTDSFYIGTSTPSLLEYNDGFFKNIHISGTCTGCGGGGTAAYPFPLTGNATSTLTQFNGGLTAYASSTIGDGTRGGGLTISGGATTTGNAYFGGLLSIATTTNSNTQITVGGAVGGANWMRFCREDSSFFCSFLSSNNGAYNYTNTGGGFFSWSNGATFSGGSWTGGTQDLALRGGTLIVGTSTNNTATGGHLQIWGKRGFTDYFQITNADAGTATPTGDILKVDGSGNVGIATTSPVAKFEVNGNAFVNGTINTSGNTGGYKIDGNLILQASSTRTSLFLGQGAGNTSYTGTANTGIGTNALTALTNGTGAIAIGPNALADATSTKNDIAIGNGAMQHYNTDPTGTQSNVAIGLSSMIGVAGQSFGVRNVAIGERTLQSNTTGNRNMALGYVTLGGNTSGSDNAAYGYTSMTANTIGVGNVAVGATALSVATSSSGNVAIGSGAMDQFVGGQGIVAAASNNTAVGERALEGAASLMTSSNNVAVGQQAISRLTTGGANTGIGYRVGLNISTGANNVLLGQQNAGTLTTGSNNTVIGTAFNGGTVDVPASGTSNYVSLSNLIYGNLAAGLGGNAGVGTTTPWGRFSIAGTPGGTLPLFAISSSTAASATSSVFHIDSNGLTGISSSTPGSLLSLGGIANFTTATSTFYSTGGIVLTGGCLTYTVGGACVGGGSSGVSSVTGTYPVISSGGSTPAISLAFSTTTANTWSGLNAFSNTGTTTFSGGIESGTKIAAPYFNATSTTLFSTFPNASTTNMTALGSLFAATSTFNAGIVLSASQPATSTTNTLDWAQTGPQVEYQLGTSAMTINITDATTSAQWGSRKLVWICNPGVTAGALTWTGVEWIGAAPTQTTLANQCDVYSFDVTRATSTSAYKVAGSQGAGFQ